MTNCWFMPKWKAGLGLAGLGLLCVHRGWAASIRAVQVLQPEPRRCFTPHTQRDIVGAAWTRMTNVTGQQRGVETKGISCHEAPVSCPLG